MKELRISSTDKRSTIHDGIEDALRTSLAKIEGNASLDLLLAWWSAPVGKALVLKTRGLGGAVRSAFVDDALNVEMIGSPQVLNLTEFALRTLGFGDFRDVGMEEAKVVAYTRRGGVQRRCRAAPIHLRHHQAGHRRARPAGRRRDCILGAT
jgi:hypothetical protein